MFDQLFFRSNTLTRQLSAPLVDERRQYLSQCAAQGMSRSTLRAKARLLLSIAEYLRLAERPCDTITLLEIKKAARQWSSERRSSRESSHAKLWMGHAHKDLTDQYAEQLREDVKYRREWCEKIGIGFALPTNVSQLSQPKRGGDRSRKAA